MGDGDDRARLEVLATEVGVRDRVHFAGLIDPADLPRHYCLADVFVMPSTGEGFGIAFLEAMASGVRVVGGDRDGSCDPLADGMLGTTIDPENEDELAAAICAALLSSRTETPDYTRFGICALRRIFNQSWKYGCVCSRTFPFWSVFFVEIPPPSI